MDVAREAITRVQGNPAAVEASGGIAANNGHRQACMPGKKQQQAEEDEEDDGGCGVADTSSKQQAASSAEKSQDGHRRLARALSHHNCHQPSARAAQGCRMFFSG